MSEDGAVQVDVGGVAYTLVPQPIRTSLSDSPAAMWGFEVNVYRGDELLGVKTCFVGRVRVHTKAPDAVDGPITALLPVLHEIAIAKVAERLEAGAFEDEILFA